MKQTHPRIFLPWMKTKVYLGVKHYATFLVERRMRDLAYISPDLSILVACVMEAADRRLPLVGPLVA